MRKSKFIFVPGPDLKEIYARAFKEATEIYILSAYLTAWQHAEKSRPECRVKIIIGEDFGITRVAACKKLLRWLSKEDRENFRVATRISGFHPKVLFWKDRKGLGHVLVGSSNLTEAAFGKNYEANLYQSISEQAYRDLCAWFDGIVPFTMAVSPSWFKDYDEAKLNGKKVKGHVLPVPSRKPPEALVPNLSKQQETRLLAMRRRQVRAFSRISHKLKLVLEAGARRKLTNAEIFDGIMNLWGKHPSRRFQANGWERTGKRSNWRLFCRGMCKIFEADPSERDEVVAAVIDEFSDEGLATRGSMMSEMLCHFFKIYPVQTAPVRHWLKEIEFRGSWGAGEGAKYIELTKVMRAAAEKHSRVKTLAELDLLIWAWFNQEEARNLVGVA